MTPKPPLENPRIYAFGPFRMEVAERRLSRDGADIALTRKAFDLLVELVMSAGHLKTREELIGALWPNTIVEEHSLTWNLSALRRALGDTGDAPQYIETVRGHGYRFIAQVHDDEELIGAPWKLSVAPEHSVVAAIAVADFAPTENVGAVDAAPTRRSKKLVAIAGALLLAVVAGTAAWMAAHRAPAGADESVAPRSVAVLPFENLSPDPANAYFASGIQDTILTKLAGIHDLRVVSRSSTEGFNSHPEHLDDVIRQLNVGNVLEGSVQKAGDQVLINVQLIDGASGGHLWAQTYTRTLDKVFEVQSDVAEQVALALRAQLLPGEASRVASLPTEDAEAYDLFLKAEYAALQIESGRAMSPAAATSQAREMYQKALVRDPRFALAWARLSYLESHAYWLDIDHTPARAAAGQKAAEQALALDPELAQAHLAMGYAYYYGHRDYSAALTEFERARRDLPNNADISASIANIDRRLGRWDAALTGYERAAVLDPRNPQWSILLGDSLTTLRRYDEAEAAYERARAVDPDNTSAALYESLTLLMAGDANRADAILAQLPRDADPEGLGTAIRFVSAWLADDADRALAVLAAAPPSIEAPWTPGFAPTDLLRAQALELKGDREAALAAYARARDVLSVQRQTQPDNPAVLSLLGLALVGLGEKEAAIEVGQRAVALLPLAEDAVDGPYYPATLVEIQARAGDSEAAAKGLRELLAIPAGRVVSAPQLMRDPRFAALRARLAMQP